MRSTGDSDDQPTLRRSRHFDPGDAPELPRAAPAQVGPHVLVREIGRGGMGVVYLGHDTRLDRPVAIKSLPAHLAPDPLALERLEREARAVAAIQHPNVAAIFGLEEQDGTPYLILEFVEGRTLADALTARALPVDEALSTCAQIAAGLEAAHERGLTHRDLKPSNVMITSKGVAKILDFGLARRVSTSEFRRAATSETARGLPSTRTPADEERMTEDGYVLGTPGYMSPEQLRDEPLAESADIWALGCVLFECLAGRPAFPGASIAARTQATLEAEPDWTLLPTATPGSLRALLRRCLSKASGERVVSAGGARTVMVETLEAREWESAGDTESGAANVATNLRPSTATFVGRAAELRDVSGLLVGSPPNTGVGGREPPCRMVTLVGPGGSGKTRLATEFALARLGYWRDGVWLVDLAPLDDPRLLPSAIAATLSIRESADGSLHARIAEHVGGGRVLLILDNCDRLVAECGALALPLLESCPSLQILATSRQRLGVAGERVLSVEPLEVPSAAAGDDPATVLSCDAVRLFVDRARLLSPGFGLVAENAADIARICRRVDGLPLAIELAASRVSVLAPAQILARLEDRFRILASTSTSTSTGAVIPSRQRAMLATIEWSHELLSEPERTLLRRLSVFSGGLDLEAAERICSGHAGAATLVESEILDILSSLALKSLVGVVMGASTSRYRLLESVRDFAAGRLDASGESEAMRLRHREHYLRLAEEGVDKLKGPEQLGVPARLAPDDDNMRGALNAWHDDAGGVGGELRLATAMGRLWEIRGLWTDAREILRRSLERPSPESARSARAGALHLTGMLAATLGDLRAARAALQEAIPLLRQTGDQSRLAAMLNGLGIIAAQSSDLLEARALFTESLELCRTGGADARGITMPLNNLGTIAYALEEHDAAHAAHEEALALARAGRDLRASSLALAGLGNVAAAVGDLSRALALHGECLALRRELGDVGGACVALSNVAAMELDLGQTAAAEAHLAECLVQARRIGSRRVASLALGVFARVLLARGRAELAATLLGAAHAARDGMGIADPPRDQRVSAFVEAQIVERLGADAHAAARAHGAALDLHAAINLALGTT